MSGEALQEGDALRAQLAALDGRSYRAYKEIRGAHAFERCSVHIDHVQGDPFAAPSKIRVRVPAGVNRIPEAPFDNPVRRFALEDFLARQTRNAIGCRFSKTGSTGF